MGIKYLFTPVMFFAFTCSLLAQTQQDSVAIKQAALDYIESQLQVKPEQMERALHPRMVK